MYHNNEERRVTLDIFRYAKMSDLIKITISFLSPALLIHLLILFTIPDLIESTGRMWLFVISLLGGGTLAGFYIRYGILPSILSRIIDKEAILRYQTRLLNVEKDHSDTIDEEDRNKIKELQEKTGMSFKDAQLTYMKMNFNNLEKRIKTLQLPPANVDNNIHKEDEY